MVKTALILAGHGSHISPHTAGVVWWHVDRLRALGAADEITAAFWKEMPSFHRVFETLEAQDITVVPIFTAQGYFTQTVIPTEMRLNGAITRRNERLIRYTRTPNEHPELARVVHQRVEEARRQAGATTDQIAVAVIGHSTRRNPDSRKAAEHQVMLLQEAGAAAEVIAVYLDDLPSIPDVYGLTSAPILICVPFFVAAGSHTTLDVPSRLGLREGESNAQIEGRTVIYTPPVGIEESLTAVILDLAREVGAPVREAQSPGAIAAASAWDHFPSAGREALIDAVETAGTLRLGDLLLTRNEVRPVGFDASALNRLTDEQISPNALRAHCRGDAKNFRPLPTSRDLPTDWRVPVRDPAHLHAVVETIYPGMVADWAAARRGKLSITTVAATAARQTGMFRNVHQLSDWQQRDLAAQTCGNCVLHPAWFAGTISDDLRCAEPCNVWLSAAAEMQHSEVEHVVLGAAQAQ